MGGRRSPEGAKQSESPASTRWKCASTDSSSCNNAPHTCSGASPHEASACALCDEMLHPSSWFRVSHHCFSGFPSSCPCALAPRAQSQLSTSFCLALDDSPLPPSTRCHDSSDLLGGHNPSFLSTVRVPPCGGAFFVSPGPPFLPSTPRDRVPRDPL